MKEYNELLKKDKVLYFSTIFVIATLIVFILIGIFSMTFTYFNDARKSTFSYKDLSQIYLDNSEVFEKAVNAFSDKSKLKMVSHFKNSFYQDGQVSYMKTLYFLSENKCNETQIQFYYDNCKNIFDLFDFDTIDKSGDEIIFNFVNTTALVYSKNDNLDKLEDVVYKNKIDANWYVVKFG